MGLFAQITNQLLYPVAWTIVNFQSEAQRVKTALRKPEIKFEATYSGQPVLIVALFEKTILRPDIERLLSEARRQGFYILAVNTLKLRNPNAKNEQIDCYIEKPNFGRDFSSYRTAFQHLYARGWEEKCPRVLMLNDSVYFSSRGLSEFLSAHQKSTIEALGATENFEMEHHLGSFCISLSNAILNHGRFQTFWKRYRASDVRPVVIRRGEMKLSKTLRKSISSQGQFKALFGTDWFFNKIKGDSILQSQVIVDCRCSPNTGWPRLTTQSLIDFISKRYIFRKVSIDSNIEVSVQSTPQELKEELFVSTRADLVSYLSRNLTQFTGTVDDIIGDAIAAVASEIFIVGSQIHQNATILLELGLPIIKLDGAYRGMWDMHDLLKLQGKLEISEARELSALLLDRPYGGNTLHGWKRAAFMRGLI